MSLEYYTTVSPTSVCFCKPFTGGGEKCPTSLKRRRRSPERTCLSPARAAARGDRRAGKDPQATISCRPTIKCQCKTRNILQAGSVVTKTCYCSWEHFSRDIIIIYSSTSVFSLSPNQLGMYYGSRTVSHTTSQSCHTRQVGNPAAGGNEMKFN